MRTVVQWKVGVVLLAVVVPLNAAADGGVGEINQVVVDAGLPPCDSNPGFPCVLDQPGSYRLTGDLECLDPDLDIISVETDDVTLDLNGHALLGPNTCALASGGVSCTYEGYARGAGVRSSGDRVTVRNGTVRGTAGNGIELRLCSRVEGIRIDSAGYNGIAVDGGSLIKDCTIRLATASGLALDRGSVGYGNVVRQVSEVLVTNGSIVGDTQILEATAVGLWLLEGTVARDCIVNDARICLLQDDVQALAPHTGGVILRISATDCIQHGLAVNGDGICGYASSLVESGGATVASGAVEIGPNICNGSSTCP